MLPVTSQFIFLYELRSAHLDLQRPCPGVAQEYTWAVIFRAVH